MASKAYVNIGEKSTTACVLSLMDRYFGNGLVFFCDSWFGSLNYPKLNMVKKNGFEGNILCQNDQTGTFCNSSCVPLLPIQCWFSKKQDKNFAFGRF